MQCRYCNRRDVRHESLRCFGRSLKRRCRGLHELTSERVNVPAHVQLWIHRFWSVYMQCRYCNRRDMLCERMYYLYELER